MKYIIITILAVLLGYGTAYAQVSGTVFRDFDADGVKDNTATFNEVGLSGVTVTAYGPAGTPVGTTISGANGTYTINSISGAVRIEFTGLQAGDYSSKSGGTSVQFVTAPTTGVNFAVNYPSDFVGDTNPYLAIPQYVNGTYNNAGSGAETGIYSFLYNDTGNPSGTENPGNTKALISTIGATWGVAYQRTTKTLFASAVMRRFCGLGPLGTGGIYKIDMTNPTSNSGASNYINVNTIGINTGADVRTASGCDAVATSPLTPANDIAGGANVGKLGIGDIDYDEPRNTLWLVNMYDKKLYGISNINPSSTPTASNVIGGYNIALPSGYSVVGGELRPWGLKVHRGMIYVGAVADASISQDIADLEGYVLKFDPSNPSAGFSVEFTFEFDYPHPIYGQYSGLGRWFYWLDNNSIQELWLEQPAISDIEFDVDGSLIIGVMDRGGMQNGQQNNNHRSCNTNLYDGGGQGDIIRACKTTGGYILSGSAGCTTTIPPTVQIDSDGDPAAPNTWIQEYYWGEHGPANDNTSFNETAMGALAFLPGSNQIITTSMDPENYQSGGVVTLNNTTGGKENVYNLYYSDPSTGSKFMAKAIGIGDIEIIANPPPLEIGNRVWNDTDGDGVQDAGETGIGTVQVQLYQGTTLVGTTNTDTNGNYYFNSGNVTGGVLPNTAYEVRLLTSQTPVSSLSLTTANNDITTNGDVRDSDASGTSTAVIALTTGNLGENNHTYDFGFRAAACSVTVTGAVPTTCNPISNTYNLAVTVTYTNQPTGNITINVGGTNYTFTPDGTSPDTYTVMGLASNGTAGVDVSATFVGDATCTHTLTDAYNAPANCACNTSITLLVGDLLQSGGGSIHTFIFDPTTPTMCNAASLPGGEGMSVDYTNGFIYIVDATNSQILKYDIATETYSVLSATLPCWSYDLDLSNDGQYLYVTCTSQIYKVNTSTGAVVASLSETAFSGSNNLWGVAVDPVTGNVYVTRGFNGSSPISSGSLSMVDANLTSGSVTTLATVTDGSLLMGIEFAPDGTLWVVRDGKGVVSDAVLNYQLNGTLIATYPMTPDLMANNEPTDLAFGPDGNLYVATWLNYCVVKYDFATSSWSPFIGAAPGSNGKTLAFACGLVNCPPCSLTVTGAVPTACDPATDTYDLAVTVTYANQPTGNITINVGGTNYTFTPDGTSPDTYTVTGLASNGTAGVDVSATFVGDATCTHTLIDAYNAPASCACNLTANANGTNVSCNGGTDGTASATASGNTGAVTYLWSNNATTQNISGLAAGDYTVTITETPTCTAVATYTVTEPTAMSLTCNKTDVTTNGGSDGTASVSATGGTSPYTYLWDSSETTSSISGKTAGTYTVTVTDDNGCTATCGSQINEPGCNLTANANGTNVSCNGGTDGTASATASGNTGAVTYLWSNNATTQNISGLAAGDYTVTVTETPTCTAVATYTVTEPTAISLTCSKTDVTTNGGSDGTVSVSATGGTSPYTYLWTGGATTSSISGKTAGTYTVTVTDNNGCTASCSSTINEPGALCNLTSAGLANVVCNNNGTTSDASDDYISFTLNPTGTTLGSSYTVSVSGGSITPNTGNYGSPTTFQLQNGSAGSGSTITVTVTDNTDTNCKVQIDIPDTGSCSTPACPPVRCTSVTVTKNQQDTILCLQSIFVPFVRLLIAWLSRLRIISLKLLFFEKK